MIEVDNDSEKSDINTMKDITKCKRAISNHNGSDLMDRTKDIDFPGQHLDQTPVYADVLQRMNREELVERINFIRLQPAGIKELLNQRYPRSDFAANLVSALFELTKGIPELFVRYLGILEKKAVIFSQDSIWYNRDIMDQENLAREIVEDSDLVTIIEQTRDLSEDHVQLLSYASLMAVSFDHKVLAAITCRSKIQMLEYLIYLKDRKYLLRLENDLFQFKYASTKLVFFKQTDARQVPRMHLELAKNILSPEELDPDQKTFMLAFHFSRSGDTNNAFKYLIQAGYLSIQNFAFAEAREFYKKALKLVHFEKPATNPHHFTIPTKGIALAEPEKSIVTSAMEKAAGNLSHAARLLRISRGKLRYRLEKLCISFE